MFFERNERSSESLIGTKNLLSIDLYHEYLSIEFING